MLKYTDSEEDSLSMSWPFWAHKMIPGHRGPIDEKIQQTIITQKSIEVMKHVWLQ